MEKSNKLIQNCGIVCAHRFLRCQILLLPNPYLYRNVIFHKAGRICFVCFDVLVELFKDPKCKRQQLKKIQLQQFNTESLGTEKNFC